MGDIKLGICVMGQDASRTLKLCFESVKEADFLVYIDGGSTDSTFNIIENFEIDNKKTIEFISNKFDKEDPKMNGRQRNVYLDYLKKNHLNEYVLCVDADEILQEDGIKNIKKFLQDEKNTKFTNIHDLHMRHFISDLGHEDNTTPRHYVPRRLFKIKEDLYYPEVEHPVLLVKEGGVDEPPRLLGKCDTTTLWHMAYIPNLWEIKRRYDGHVKKSNMHSPEFLKQWYNAHLFGVYPRVEVQITEIPKIILEAFGINRDEWYFMHRMNLEVKNFLMCKQWNELLSNKARVLDLGAGVGHFGYVFTQFLNKDYLGIELSKWAVNNSPYKDVIKLEQGNILEYNPQLKDKFDLIICSDILEHLDYEDLDKALANISQYGDKVLFSIPFLGDPNLESDPTHVVKETKQWWIDLLGKYWNIQLAPQHFLYHWQILIGTRK